MADGIFCAPVPLKFTVFGIAAVTFKLPAVMVNMLDIPKTELVESNKEVPFKVALNKLAVPFKVTELKKVTVPNEAENVPLISNAFDTEKLEAVVTVPGISKPKNPIVPAPLIVLVAPLIVIFPVLALKLPETKKLPETNMVLVVVTEPDTVKFPSEMLLPVIVFVAPVIVSVLPATCVNDPTFTVAKLPDKVSCADDATTPAALTERLLKFCSPVPEMVEPGPVKVIVLVLPVKVPLFTQLPPTEILCDKPLNVVETPISTFPEIVILDAAE